MSLLNIAFTFILAFNGKFSVTLLLQDSKKYITWETCYKDGHIKFNVKMYLHKKSQNNNVQQF